MKIITIDTETGGLNPLTDALLQIGAYEPATGARFNVYIEPAKGLRVTQQAAKVNGYPDSHAGKSVISEAEAITAFAKWLHLILPDQAWAHNAPFDYSFIRHAIARNVDRMPGLSVESMPRFLCTMTQADQLNRCGGLPVQSLSLNSLIKELLPDYKRSENHDASEDAYITYLIHMEMNARFDNLTKLANTAVMTKPTQQNKQPTRRQRFGFGR